MQYITIYMYLHVYHVRVVYNRIHVFCYNTIFTFHIAFSYTTLVKPDGSYNRLYLQFGHMTRCRNYIETGTNLKQLYDPYEWSRVTAAYFLPLRVTVICYNFFNILKLSS